MAGRVYGVLLLAARALAQNTEVDSGIPDYVLKYAPLLYLDVNEQFYPSDIAAQIYPANTYPTYNYTAITNAPSTLTLTNLASLNSLGDCHAFGSCNVYLTSHQHMTVDGPFASWLHGVLPNPSTGETENATSCAVIVRDHNDANNTVDAFYMYFYAFNRGTPAIGTYFDNHVGDWEHTMVRFVGGEPSIVYFSEHDSGEAYTYDAVLKDNQTHTRPLGFPSRGGHATYPQPGIHPLLGGIANDSTSYGPLWDPVAGSGAWYYTFVPDANTDSTNGSFMAVDVPGRTARGPGSTDWLYFLGQWGDEEYNSSYPGQQIVPGIAAVFGSGPTGPLDKGLSRSQACPGNAVCITHTTVTSPSGTIVQTVSRTYTGISASTTAESSSTSATVASSPASSAGATSSSAQPSQTGAAVSVLASYQWQLASFLTSVIVWAIV